MTKLTQLLQQYKSIIAYLFWGVVTTIINLASYQLLIMFTHVSISSATTIAWFISVLVAYLTNKVWVFGSAYTTVSDFLVECGRFFFYRALTLLIDLAFMNIGVHVLGFDSDLQQFILKVLDNVVVVIANYIFSKWLIFNRNKDIADK